MAQTAEAFQKMLEAAAAKKAEALEKARLLSERRATILQRGISSNRIRVDYERVEESAMAPNRAYFDGQMNRLISEHAKPVSLDELLEFEE